VNRALVKSLGNAEADWPAERVARRLRRAGVNSTSDLARAAEQSRGNAAAFYIWLLGRCGGPRAERALLRVLQGLRRSLWLQAGVSLTLVGTARSARALMEIALHAREPERREAAVYALGYVTAGSETHAVIKALVKVLDNDPVPRVRGQAAESVTQLLRFRRGKLRASAESALIRHLHDDAADVRFWCAYAVGELRSKAAVPALRRLTRDRAVLARWWSIGTEARDALTVIRGGTSPERIGNAGGRPYLRGTSR
jgi:HEAT repeat protein